MKKSHVAANPAETQGMLGLLPDLRTKSGDNVSKEGAVGVIRSKLASDG